MPLDAQDKLRVEIIEEFLAGVTAPEKLRDALVRSGGDLVRGVFEIVPPDSIYREKIIRRLEDAIEIIITASRKTATTGA